MKCSVFPGVEYRAYEEYESLSASEFYDLLSDVDDDVVALWCGPKEREAQEGLWFRQGTYKLKHISLIDPFDLSCYGGQVYVRDDDSGRHACLQLGHAAIPEDARPIPTVGALKEALRLCAGCGQEAPVEGDGCAADASSEGQADAQGAPAEGSCPADGASLQQGAEQPQEQSAPRPPAPELKLLEPDARFEYHGALTKGWHAVSYRSESAEEHGAPSMVIVFD